MACVRGLDPAGDKMPKRSTMPLAEFLESHGITRQDMTDAILEMFVPHPGVETKEKAVELINEQFREVLTDVNVSCLEVACFRAERDARDGLIPGLTKERFMGRPGLVADELLGMTIADYIAGTRGIFEFVRFDKEKPGILKRLGPIENDAIGGLIAGISSNMYSRATAASQLDSSAGTASKRK